ncbi:MAG TPA: thioredoxin family protein [bacterium]|nr:thioredoxin family protein [bacterium]
MGVKIDIVFLEEPCSACLIIFNLIKEIMERLKGKYDFLEVNYIEIKKLEDLHSIKGLEVEKFPAIIIDGEQISAGTIPDIGEIEKIISLKYREALRCPG